MTNRSVLVLNHFARHHEEPGGTRHAEMFSKLDGWNARIIAGDRGLLGRGRRRSHGIVETVRVFPYSGNGPARVVNWVSYAVTSLVRGVRVRRVDVVYGSSPHLLAPVSAWVIARIRRAAFVLEIRDVWPKILVEMGAMSVTNPIYRALLRLERFLYRRADWIVYMADGVERHLVANGADPDRLTFIPNAADPADFRVEESRDVLRDHYGFEGVVAIYAGAHGPADGLDLLLDAAVAAAPCSRDLRIVLIGDGVEKPRLQDRVRCERIDNVDFRDPIPKLEIPALLFAADIGVHCLADVPLFREGVSPNKLFDYMAAGLPVITNTPGICSDFVRAADGGQAVAPDGLAEGLVFLAQMSTEGRQKIGERGRDFLGSTRSRTAMATKLAAVLDSATGVRTSKGRLK